MKSGGADCASDNGKKKSLKWWISSNDRASLHSSSSKTLFAKNNLVLKKMPNKKIKQSKT